MADIMTTRELAGYLKLHEITICKYAANGEIPAIRIGRVWRFDKEAIDEWIVRGQSQPQDRNESGRQVTQYQQTFVFTPEVKLEKEESVVLHKRGSRNSTNREGISGGPNLSPSWLLQPQGDFET